MAALLHWLLLFPRCERSENSLRSLWEMPPCVTRGYLSHDHCADSTSATTKPLVPDRCMALAGGEAHRAPLDWTGISVMGGKPEN